jgi:transposase
MHKCFNTHRYFYNKAIAEINKRYEEQKAIFQGLTHCIHCNEPKVENKWLCKAHEKRVIPWKLNITLQSIRGSVMKTDKQLKDLPNQQWEMEIPFDTRQLAIKDAITAYKSAGTNLKRGNIQSFELKFKSRRECKKIFWMDASALMIHKHKCHLFKRRLKEHSQLRLSSKSIKRLPTKNTHDAKILYDRGAYYLLLSVDFKNQPVKEGMHPIVSLDPGVRTFMTGYSPTGVIFKLGEPAIEIMKKLHDKIDLLRSVRSKKIKRKTKWRINQRLQKLERTLFNQVDNLHNQSTSYLTNNFESILLPKFCTHEMLQGNGLACCVKRRMASLAHYRFQQKLIFQCQKKGNKLYIVGEEYTTKACGSCGRLKNVGGSKIYTCNHCGYTMDRDIHGARNILLKTCSTFGV